MAKSLKETQFKYTGRTKSPSITTKTLVKSVDNEGKEVITFIDSKIAEKVEYGSADDWTLKSLMAAGINPSSFHINTSGATRLEAAGSLSDFAAEADVILSENTKTE